MIFLKLFTDFKMLLKAIKLGIKTNFNPMKNKGNKLFCISCFLLYSFLINAQNTVAKGGVSLKAEFAFGSQNQHFKLGSYFFGTINIGNFGTESGTAFSVYLFTKRHGLKIPGLAYSYELFAMTGWGKSTNLLGSTIAILPTESIFNPKGVGGFGGIGFGINKDILPRDLKKFNSRRGNFLLRYSNSNYSINLNFSNDMNFLLFKGQGTDLGATGSLIITAVEIRGYELRRLGIGLDVFTPVPDYLQLPRNTINSDDGWRNVWFNTNPYKDLLHANLYVDARFQENAFSWAGKIGVDSPKIGAYVQNVIHDSFGLFPRFSWPVEQNSKLFYEFTANINATITNDFNHLRE
ncbi:MAG: hypothetical protein CVU03_11125 [Bacteroidetes bacterium HGW-Bacteroidetes-2]|nr:MAG: hypothetical protein CVU03_11125 [Bacteroidetes bacterium HGW-Bacteroidetes-2]